MIQEEFDIYNEQMIKIGIASRQQAHALGLWHQTFHCWVVRTSATAGFSLLFQLRHPDKDTFPSLLDISCAGHLTTGEGPETDYVNYKKNWALKLHLANSTHVACLKWKISYQRA
ncbi:isopentenyldiphosphate isomerase [Paenibacillus sp. DS2015]|uniref:NUDIX hydrolase n=1 Tax=Paenibacillus sp. DS2015 TaxID=3373917 RepID=UPI003D23BFE9